MLRNKLFFALVLAVLMAVVVGQGKLFLVHYAIIQWCAKMVLKFYCCAVFIRNPIISRDGYTNHSFDWNTNHSFDWNTNNPFDVHTNNSLAIYSFNSRSIDARDSKPTSSIWP